MSRAVLLAVPMVLILASVPVAAAEENDPDFTTLVWPQDITPDVPVPLVVYVDNWGFTASPATTLELRIDGVLVEVFDVPAMEPFVWMEIITSYTGSAGVHVFEVLADPTNEVREWDEENNLAQATIEFTNVRPDIAIASHEAVVVDWPTGSKFRLTYEVCNTGIAPATNIRAFQEVRQHTPSAAGFFVFFSTGAPFEQWLGPLAAGECLTHVIEADSLPASGWSYEIEVYDYATWDLDYGDHVIQGDVSTLPTI